MTRIDRQWRDAHPLPRLGQGQDKAGRGTLLVVGGSALSPGACALTAKAALRVGAGRVRVATLGRFVPALSASFPECAFHALTEGPDDQITCDTHGVNELVDGCDAVVVGPGTMTSDPLSALTVAILSQADHSVPILLDAGAIGALRAKPSSVRGGSSAILITPHHGELAKLTGCPIEAVAAEPQAFAMRVVAEFGAHVVLKDCETHIAAPGQPLLAFASKAPGLGTAGSGDVLAGAIAGLLARGVEPLEAAAWGVHLHGRAGRAAGRKHGKIGYLATDLLPFLSRLASKRTKG